MDITSLLFDLNSFGALALFTGIVAVLLIIDLVVLAGKEHTVSMREAAIMTGIWTAVAVAVGVWVFIADGSTLVERESHGIEYVTAYIAERALSIDNLFAFLIIFGYFGLPEQFRSKALMWGIVLALITRGLFIFAGVELINRFEWVLYILGAILIYSAYKLATSGDSEVDPSKNIVLRVFKRFMPVSDEYDRDKFFTVKNGVRMATPFLLVVIVLASTDIVFAVDSIPTVFAISRDNFVIWSSNAMAVLGMRPLFFLIEGLVAYFRFLSYGLAAILGFIGVKMIFETSPLGESFEHWLHDIGIAEPHLFVIIISLAIVVAILVVSVIASVIAPASDDGHHGHGGGPEPQDSTA